MRVSGSLKRILATNMNLKLTGDDPAEQLTGTLPEQFRRVDAVEEDRIAQPNALGQTHDLD